MHAYGLTFCLRVFWIPWTRHVGPLPLGEEHAQLAPSVNYIESTGCALHSYNAIGMIHLAESAVVEATAVVAC